MIKKFKLFAVAAAIIIAASACKSTKSQETVYEPEQVSEVISELPAESTPTPTFSPTPSSSPAPTATLAPAKEEPEQTADNTAPPTAEENEQKHLCTLSVQCKTVLDNMDKLSPSAVVPADGVIFSEKQVEVIDGESVFDLLLRTMKQEGIHLEFSGTPIYNSTYIEGINNLYEFDCGELSGWMYKVNGVFPKKGCSEVFLKSGDVVEWIYTCDLGKDIGDSMN